MLDKETSAPLKAETPMVKKTITKGKAEKKHTPTGSRFQHSIPKPKAIDTAKTKTKTTVKKASTSKAHDLVRKLRSNKSAAIIRNNYELMPILDNITRWNTVYECLCYYRRISSNKDVIQELIADKKLGISLDDFINSEEERQEVDNCISILKEIKITSLISQGNCYSAYANSKI
jgi:uncharacterized protein YcbK (DUF882 family)